MQSDIIEILQNVKYGRLSEQKAELEYEALMRKLKSAQAPKAEKNSSKLVVSDKVIAENTTSELKLLKQDASQAATDKTFAEEPFDRRYFCQIKHCDNPVARLFIFLPFGFGNSSVSWSWSQSLEDIEMWVAGADNIANWNILTIYLSNRMLPLCDIPFLVHGHSMGGVVAYEVLRYLEHKHGVSPLVFIPSSTVPPHIFERAKYMSPFNAISTEMTMATCRRILEKNHVLLPSSSGVNSISDDALANDISLVKSYRYKEQKKALSCPIISLHANNDIVVKDPVGPTLWQIYTQAEFSYQEVEGTHLYFMNPPASVFSMIESFTKDSADNTLAPGTYCLKSYELGTDEMKVYPYGTSPMGYIFYDAQGCMSAHLWDSNRNKSVQEREQEQGNDLKSILTYQSYAGGYEYKSGIIEHEVYSSTNSNLIDEKLTRYLRVEGKELALKTAPYTEYANKQSKNNAFATLVWTQIPGTSIDSENALLGAWKLESHLQDGEKLFGETPRGFLQLMPSGHFSLILTKEKCEKNTFENIVFITDEEIERASKSISSCCGSFELKGSKKIKFKAEQGLFSLLDSGPSLMDFSLVGEELSLSWKRHGQKNRASVVKQKWKRFN